MYIYPQRPEYKSFEGYRVFSADPRPAYQCILYLETLRRQWTSVAKFLVPDWGIYSRLYFIGLLYRPARFHRLHGGPVRQPCARVDYIPPSQGLRIWPQIHIHIFIWRLRYNLFRLALFFLVLFYGRRLAPPPPVPPQILVSEKYQSIR